MRRVTTTTIRRPAAFFLMLCLSLLASIGRAAEKPNLIVIYTDDHGYADLSCQGVYTDVRTPHLDALATGGVRMTSGYVLRSAVRAVTCRPDDRPVPEPVRRREQRSAAGRIQRPAHHCPAFAGGRIRDGDDREMAPWAGLGDPTPRF